MNKILAFLNKNKLIVILSLMIMIIFFMIIYPTVLTVHDDIVTYMYTRSGFMKEYIRDAATNQGRIFFMIIYPLMMLPYMANSLFVVNLFSFFSIFFSVISLWYLLYRHLDKSIAFLSFILFFSLAQIGGEHNLFVSYILQLQIPIGIMLLSIERYLTCLKKESKYDKILSATLYLAALVSGELFLLFSIVFFIFSLNNKIESSKLNLNIKETILAVFKDLKYHIIVSLIYIAIYFGWQIMYPSTYEGSTLYFGDLKGSITVILTYAIGLIPLNSVIRSGPYNFEEVIANINLLCVAKACLSAYASYYLIKRSKAITINLRLWLLVSSLCVFLPVFLLGFSSKYIEWVKAGSRSYTMSFYSYFFIIIILAILMLIFHQKLKYKKFTLIIICSIIFIGSIFTDISNQKYVDYSNERLEKYILFDKMMGSDYFENVEAGSNVYMPDFSGIHGYMSWLNKYSEIYNESKQYNFVNDFRKIDSDLPTYYFKYDNSSKVMFSYKFNSGNNDEKLYLISKYSLKDKSILIKYHDSINDCDTWDEFYLNDNEYEAEVNLNGNVIEEIDIIERTEKNVLKLYALSEGFYGEENWGNSDIASWCNGEGVIEIFNSSNVKIKKTINFYVASYDAGESNLQISYNKQRNEFKLNNNEKEISVDLLLEPGTNEVVFKSDALGIPTGDGRKLSFYLKNLKMY